MARYWSCPKCGAVLDKGPQHEAKTLMYLSAFSRTHGTVTCGRCQSRFPVQDIYRGKYDLTPGPKELRGSKKTVRKGKTTGGILSWLKGVFEEPSKGKKKSSRPKKKAVIRKPTRRIGRCGQCWWYSEASLDGIYGKGICNYGSGQRPPFTMSPGVRVKIAWGKERGCEHFKAIDLRQKN